MSTIQEIIKRVDENKPNAFAPLTKMKWISDLDGKIAADVFLMDIAQIRELQYVGEEGLKKEPLVSYPHDDIYDLWLEAKIDAANGEYNRYQNTMQLYNESYGNFVRWFASVYEPAQGNGECGFAPRSNVPTYYLTAYGLAVKQGFVGTLDEWLASLVGPQGPQGPQGIQGPRGNQGPRGKQGPQGLSGTDPVAIAEALDKALDEDERLLLRSEGAASNYYLKNGGWKRILIGIRSNCGFVNLTLNCNVLGGGRTYQNITFGYSMFADHPSAKDAYLATSKAPHTKTKGPVLYQIHNHTFGEDPNQTRMRRLFRIDKVRIAYPLSWDDTEDWNTENRYSNPINAYLDVHVAGDFATAAGYVQLMVNVTGKTYNHRVEPILEETDAPVDAEGNVLGLDDVKCSTYEMELWENGMFMVPGSSRFDTLISNRLERLEEKTVGCGCTVPIKEERVSVSSVNLLHSTMEGSEEGDPRETRSIYLRAAYKSNLLPCNESLKAASLGVTVKKLYGGLIQVSGTAETKGLARLYEYADGKAPLVLKKGVTYYISGLQLVLMTDLNGAGQSIVYGYENDGMAVKTLAYTPVQDMYIFRASMYFKSGNIYEDHLYYPQITVDESQIVGDLNSTAEGSIRAEYGDDPKVWFEKGILPKEMYAPEALKITVNCLPIHGIALCPNTGIIECMYRGYGRSGNEIYEIFRVEWLGIYREILNKADYIWCDVPGVTFTGEMLTGVFRVPVMEDGALAADLSAGGHRITGLPAPAASDEPVTKEYADAQYNKTLPKSGGVMTGAVTMKGIYLTEGVDFFHEMPDNIPAGKLIFVEAGE